MDVLEASQCPRVSLFGIHSGRTDGADVGCGQWPHHVRTAADRCRSRQECHRLGACLLVLHICMSKFHALRICVLFWRSLRAIAYFSIRCVYALLWYLLLRLSHRTRTVPLHGPDPGSSEWPCRLRTAPAGCRSRQGSHELCAWIDCMASCDFNFLECLHISKDSRFSHVCSSCPIASICFAV
jgi:hypothetical protein